LFILILGRKLKVKAEARILGGKKANPRETNLITH
jgi:hypothetical protein